MHGLQTKKAEEELSEEDGAKSILDSGNTSTCTTRNVWGKVSRSFSSYQDPMADKLPLLLTIKRSCSTPFGNSTSQNTDCSNSIIMWIFFLMSHVFVNVFECHQ